jgi:hypothetical protein
MIWKTTNIYGQEMYWYDINEVRRLAHYVIQTSKNIDNNIKCQGETVYININNAIWREEMDKRHTKFITALADLYKVIFKTESTKEVDFLLESLHEKGEAIRKKVEE